MYWAGETVTGKVIVQSDDEKSLRLIKGNMYYVYDKTYNTRYTLKGDYETENCITFMRQAQAKKIIFMVAGLRVRCKGYATVDLKFTGSETVVNFIDEDARLFTGNFIKDRREFYIVSTVNILQSFLNYKL